MQSSFNTFLPPVAALAGIIAVIWLAARGIRLFGLNRFGIPSTQNRRLSVVESLPIGRSRQLVLVRCDGRDVLVMTGAADALVIGWLASAAPGLESRA